MTGTFQSDTGGTSIPLLSRDVYDLSKVRRKYKHQTGLERGHYIYYFNPEDLVPKWIYPANPVYLPEWDISNESTDIYVQISEIDDSETKTYTRLFQQPKVKFSGKRI